MGLFYEVAADFSDLLIIKFGPYMLMENLTLKRNPDSWTRHFDVIFLDNPVGTGYSYVDPPAKVLFPYI